MRQLLWKVSVFMFNIRCSNINVLLLMIPYQNTANLLRSPILNRKYLLISNTPKCSRLLGLLRSGEQNKSKTKQEGGERKCSDKCQWKWNRSRKKERGNGDVETEFKVCPDTTNSPSVSQVRTSAPIMGHPDRDRAMQHHTSQPGKVLSYSSLSLHLCKAPSTSACFVQFTPAIQIPAFHPVIAWNKLHS